MLINNKEIQQRLVNADQILKGLMAKLELLPEPKEIRISLEDLHLLLSQCKVPTKEKRKLIKVRFYNYY